MDPDQYCRDVETYLCRKNDGHLIRIVGPSFELVSGWAARGIPVKLVFHGIDRCFQRYYARGPRRHPVRIDFCDADVLDAFDAWRRAVGVSLAANFERRASDRAPSDAALTAKSRRSLVAHLDGVVGRLLARQTDPAAPELQSEILRTLDRLEGIRDVAAKSRGPARARLIDDLADLDRTLGAAVRDSCPAELKATLAHDAAADLEPFRERMPTAAYQQALDSCIDRLLRERLGLPRIAYG
jgi:hypothetical protein